MHRNLINAKHKRYQIFEVNTCLCGLGGVFFFFPRVSTGFKSQAVFSVPLNTTVFALRKSRSSNSYTINYWDDHSAQQSLVSPCLLQLDDVNTELSFRNNTTSSMIVMGHGFPSKIFFLPIIQLCRPRKHSTYPSQIKLPKKKIQMKRQSCEEIPFIFLFHQY